MASTIWEFFGYRSDDESPNAVKAAEEEYCPFIGERCEKTFSDATVSGVCSIKPITTGPVICCPVRLYADEYRILQDISQIAFGPRLPLKKGYEALRYTTKNGTACIAVFGKRWGGELRLPEKSGTGSYFVDWILAKINEDGVLEEFVAVEVQSIDTTGNYKNGFFALKECRQIEKTTAGLNWENVSKRILPQLIYKGQVLQREALCKKGLFFVCPEPVYDKTMVRLGGKSSLVSYPLQPASITFVAYNFDFSKHTEQGNTVPLIEVQTHKTTVYRVQEAFNNVPLPKENVFRDAILKALGPIAQ